MMVNERFTSVWDAIEPDPVLRANLRLRGTLMSSITDVIRRNRLDDLAAANVLGVDVQQAENLRKGFIDKFDVETLINMATHAGLYVEIQVNESKEKIHN